MTLFRKLSFSLSLTPLFKCFSTFHFLFLRVFPKGTQSISIDSSPSSEGIMTVSGGFSEGLGLGLSAFRRAISIFGICTRYIIGTRRPVGAGGCRSMSSSIYRSIVGSPCRSMEVLARRAIHTLSGLGGCGCFAANSS